jgi:protein TonB
MAKPPPPRRISVIVGGAVTAITLIGLFVWFVHTMLAAKSGKPDRKIQTVELIRPPPPPPPPDQPPPPPEKVDQPLPKDVPEPTPKDEPAPPAQLGLDAEGQAGGDAFGLAARAGGSDLIGGSGNSLFAWYTNRLKDAVLERLSNDTHLGAKKYSITVRVWLSPDGQVKQVKLTTTTGNRELDERIQADLASMTALREAPPLEMPQPISLKIATHG